MKSNQSEYLGLELVQEHYARARMAAQDEMGELFDDLVRREIAGETKMGSPLEAIFYAWFKAYTLARLDFMRLQAQVEVSHEGQLYRVDFAVRPCGKEGAAIDRQRLWRPIAVEVDGHAFHEKTLEQVTYRNRRDRALQQLGWKVFHFSYSEFVNAPDVCTLEVVMFARKQILALSLRAFEIEHPEIDLGK